MKDIKITLAEGAARKCMNFTEPQWETFVRGLVIANPKAVDTLYSITHRITGGVPFSQERVS